MILISMLLGTVVNYLNLLFVFKNYGSIVVVAVINIFLAYILAIIFSKQFTTPISKLVKFVKQSTTNNFNSTLSSSCIQNCLYEYKELYNEINTILEKLNQSNKELQIAAVAFEIQSGMAITDPSGKILKVNKAFSDITGYTQDEAIGQTPNILKSGLHDEEFYKNIFESLEKNHIWQGEITNKHKNGQFVNEFLMIQAVFDDKDEIIYYVSSFLDITSQKLIEEKLKQKEAIIIQQSKMAAMGEMIENIAHQWRQPLSVISTAATGMMIEKEYGISTPQKEEKSLEAINTAAQHLSQTIEDFRDFFKPNKEKIEFHIKQTYEKILMIVESQLKNKEITLVSDIEDIVLVNFENELKQVLINIINNAKDALENITTERYIFFTVKKYNDKVSISIKDNAGGVPEDIKDKIFEPYFTTKHKSQGTGIGLYMSHEIIVKHMEGSIEVQNSTFEYNGKKYTGADFRILLNS